MIDYLKSVGSGIANVNWRRLFVSIALLGVSLSFIGCGTTATHTSYFSATHPETKSQNYYRVKVSAHSDNGTTSWNTGWYSRRALDQIFSEIKTNSVDAADKMVDLYENALVELLEKYVKALKSNSTNDSPKVYLEKINDLVGVARFYLSAGATAKDAAENAGKRFVYSFTADPNLLERMVEDAVENEQLAAVIDQAIMANTPAAQELVRIRDRMTSVMRLNSESLNSIDEARLKLEGAIAESDPVKKKDLVEAAKRQLERATAFTK